MKVDGQIDIIMRLVKPIKLKHLLVTTYYCFEEVFLSFTDILTWLNIKTEQWEVDLLNTIANNIKKTRKTLSCLKFFNTFCEFPLNISNFGMFIPLLFINSILLYFKKTHKSIHFFLIK